jgi:hypothetical protein
MKHAVRIADQLGQDGAPQGLKVAPEVAYPPVQRGEMKAYDPRKQVREEAGNLTQEGAFRLHTSKLLEKGEGHDLRVRKFFESLVASPFGVEPIVSVVYSAEQKMVTASSRRANCGVSSGWAICEAPLDGELSDGPLFTLQTTQHSSRAGKCRNRPSGAVRLLISSQTSKPQILAALCNRG